MNIALVNNMWCVIKQLLKLTWEPQIHLAWLWCLTQTSSVLSHLSSSQTSCLWTTGSAYLTRTDSCIQARNQERP